MALSDQLRAHGYRMTPQRKLVLDAVTELGHATPDDAHAWVQKRAGGVNISTVYRTLEVLEEIGLVTHAHLSHGAPTYHAADAPEHLHLVCRECHTVTELPPESVASMVNSLRKEQGFETDVGHLTVFGVCQECQSQQPQSH